MSPDDAERLIIDVKQPGRSCAVRFFSTEFFYDDAGNLFPRSAGRNLECPPTSGPRRLPHRTLWQQRCGSQLRLPQLIFSDLHRSFLSSESRKSFFDLPTNVFDPPFAGTWQITLYSFDTTNGLRWMVWPWISRASAATDPRTSRTPTLKPATSTVLQPLTTAAVCTLLISGGAIVRATPSMPAAHVEAKAFRDAPTKRHAITTLGKLSRRQLRIPLCLVFGCTQLSACNYDPDANADNGTCEFASCVPCVTTAIIDSVNLSGDRQAKAQFNLWQAEARRAWTLC